VTRRDRFVALLLATTLNRRFQSSPASIVPRSVACNAGSYGYCLNRATFGRLRCWLLLPTGPCHTTPAMRAPAENPAKRVAEERGIRPGRSRGVKAVKCAPSCCLLPAEPGAFLPSEAAG